MKRTILILMIAAIIIIPIIVRADRVDVNYGGGSEVIIDNAGSGEVGFWTGIPTAEEAPGGGGVSGGGGGGGGTEQNASRTDLDEAMQACLKMNGTLSGVKGGMFCVINGTYIPIENLMPPGTVNVLGITMEDYGAMLVKDAPLMGWLAIGVMITVMMLAFKDMSENYKERKKRRIISEERKKIEAEEREYDKRRYRPDGGFY